MVRVGFAPAGEEYPLRARWTALVFVKSFGQYGFSLDGAADMLVDGQTMVARGKRLMQPGGTR